MIIGNYLTAMNANRNYKINTSAKAKSANKLSSGYKLNSAADDAAGLSISEKMRMQIRALNKGTRNAEDGISWIQIGDGALNEVHDILHRMSELSIQALNDTNTVQDRAALQAEFDELQSEIDKITSTTQFNTKNIFSEHEPVYYQVEGNVSWPQSARHAINIPQNSLTINYQKDDSSPSESVTLEVPEDIYTTQELIDEIDNVMTSSGAADKGLVFEYTNNGTCNVNFENGGKIESISGSLSYLVNDMYEGGGVGALVGTTSFPRETSRLEIATGHNDNMTFEIQNFDGTTQSVSITIPAGSYTRQELIDQLNGKLASTSVEAVKYSTGIKLQSDSAIITGFKGNMFKIDATGKKYTSVFYDNVMYGNATMTPASFEGGAVVPTSSQDLKYNHYSIDSTNNTLKISANGEPEVTITIPEGNYTVAQMATTLNDLFRANSIEVTASTHTSSNYSGLKLESSVKGLNSNITIDTASSAYNTLFTTKNYTSFGGGFSITNETKADYPPVTTGGKTFDTNNIPITITSGTNDAFILKLDSDSYTINLNAGTYSSVDDIVTEINNQLSVPLALQGKVSASNSSEKIELKGQEGSGLTSVTLEAVAGNTGYNDLFVGTNVSYTNATVSNSGTSSTPATVTLNTPVSEPTTFDNSNNTLTININGTNHAVTFPTGSLSHADIENTINTQLPPSTTTYPNTFSNINATSTVHNNSVTAKGYGNTSTSSRSFSDTGYSRESEGVAGSFAYNEPAMITIDKALPSTTTVTADNNKLKLTINGTEREITIANGTYNATQLKNEIQSKFNALCGTDENGVIVGLDNSKLTFTSIIEDANGEPVDGLTSSLSVSTNSSSFLKELYTTRTAATATSSRNLNASITIDSSNNQFTFTCNDGNSKTVNLNLTDGTYTRATLVDEINRQLTNENVDITASLSGNALKLETIQKGSGLSINYNCDSSSPNAEALFGPLKIIDPATATTNYVIQNSITIGDTSNTFNIRVNGTDYSLTLDNGLYTRDSFTTMLNDKLAGTGATVSLDGDRLKYTATNGDSPASIVMSYDTGGSSMPAIYGTRTITTPGVTASFDTDGKLVLTGTENGGSLSVSSSNGGIFQTSTRNETPINPTSTTGYISTKHACIDGTNISEPITIDSWNKELSFTYVDENVEKNVNLTLDEKDYTFAELEAALQTKINDDLINTNELTVSVTADGVKIESVGVGSKYALKDFDGSFYDKVICQSTEHSSTLSTTSKAGTQTVNPAYTVGRQDIRNNITEIEYNINDSFVFDLTYGGTTHTLSMKLDPGNYSGQALANHLQYKINEQLTSIGLPENMITAGVGGVNTGVTGSNDANALCLKLSNTVAQPVEGEYVIDGVRGNAAFYIFYQSAGKMIPAYTKGSKDISEGVEITSENNQLSFDVDGVKYDITLDEGTFTENELVDMINDKMTGFPVAAKTEDGNLKIHYNTLGNHRIDNVSGSAKDSLFYQENKGDGKSHDINLQLSGKVNDLTLNPLNRDYMTIEGAVLSTASLGINSIGISRPRYANKALTRLHEALNKVSTVRSDMGALQNRLEHVINGNNNSSETTSASESRIRDTDMAKEMVEQAAKSILQQTAQAMIAQTTSDFEGILRLLQ